MNGNDHYRASERLLAMYEDNSTPSSQDWAAVWGAQALAAAQVHATLAHAAFNYYGGLQDPTESQGPSA